MRKGRRAILAAMPALLLTLLLVSAAAAQSLPYAATVLRSARLRTGPGLSFTVAGSARTGEVLTVTRVSADGAWCELDTGQWIDAASVDLQGQPAATSTPAPPGRADPRTTPGRTAPAAPARPSPEAAYVEQMLAILKVQSDAVIAMGRVINEDPPDGSAWLENSERLAELIHQLAVIRLTDEWLAKIKPPPAMSALHGAALDASRKGRRCTDELIVFLDTRDLIAFERSAAFLDQYLRGMNDVLAALLSLHRKG